MRAVSAGPTQPCGNPLCRRHTRVGIRYCCPACGSAHEGRYEIHESGPLGHSETCNQRYAERSKPMAVRLFAPAMPRNQPITSEPPGLGQP